MSATQTAPTFFGRPVTGEYEVLSQTILDGIELYMSRKVPPGGFLRAMLVNAPVHTVLACADPQNQRTLKQISLFIHNRIPSGIWGSEAKVNKFLSEGEPFADWDWSRA